MSQLSFFNKLGPTNSKEALDFLVHSEGNLVLKIHDRHYKTKMLAKKSDREFSVYKFNFIDYQNEDIVCSFDIRDEKYFFKSFLKATATELLLSIPEEIYQLQRRNDFRVSIPSSVSYVCELKTIDYQKANLKVELRDLSLGGCLVSINNGDRYEVAKDAHVEMVLKINGFEISSLKTVAKHIRRVEQSNTLQLGLQYVEPTADFLAELQTLLVQLDRIHRGKNLD